MGMMRESIDVADGIPGQSLFWPGMPSIGLSPFTCVTFSCFSCFSGSMLVMGQVMDCHTIVHYTAASGQQLSLMN